MQRLFTVVVAGSFLVAGALAQTSEVNQREKNQQERIANGVGLVRHQPGEIDEASVASDQGGEHRAVGVDDAIR